MAIGLVVVLAAILLLPIVPPTLFLVMASVHTTKLGRLVRQLHAQLLRSSCCPAGYFCRSLWNTFVYSFGSAVIAIVLGTRAGADRGAHQHAGAALVFLGASSRLACRTCCYTVGWLLLLGKSGPVNEC